MIKAASGSLTLMTAKPFRHKIALGFSTSLVGAYDAIARTTEYPSRRFMKRRISEHIKHQVC
jgi:hypothetical protein